MHKHLSPPPSSTPAPCRPGRFGGTPLLLGTLWALPLVGAPAPDQCHVYWGDVHGHTRLSDGKGTLDDYFTYARDVAKLDFVIVSDHDFGNGEPWWMPRENWTRTQAKADEYTTDGRFVALAGYEWTSQPKYWTEVGPDTPSERLFPGPPKHYNHKNVYFPAGVDHLLCAKDPAYMSPNLLAQAVAKLGGLIHNNHPDSTPEGEDQFAYDPAYSTVIANTELLPDTLQYQGKTHQVNGEQTVRGFLNRGGRTGFVAGTDSHEGKPAARTAVLAPELTRAAVFDALRHRRNYAVTNARILLDFRLNGHLLGEEFEIEGKPRLVAEVRGTDMLDEVALIRDGVILYSISPKARSTRLEYVDQSFEGTSYYYLRVIQADKDEHGNRSHAWSSPIWVKSAE
ncbi:MAG: hypothetical protein COZ06_15840 [Armatimonadetes bacterium CG_4_10_14_3_um_filter_66_18]|nr:CehA/McbA family metallohydrolase [Armatimonadota bacterium]OIO96908.1 MAG: hypothetical protein AUJ96_24100 [Armatimonadetes bacterium CG2_30_66_41]PIX47442.1 MAG: hypothetical protein COZ57_08460 [Armatimonadetes bacterium CG_4_8_14_3_um_filter_66_20]PIY48703.1 MAG: hypothetical protein COZ06_15840 [Armatimonadetes bacterium CG_4_10_14_3_um_filter_66_18]PIZ37321.1 MAG: hypothetical protein COY42_24455 [Armatimonadetes bacterium CG_4_10_14_0_8_um_filter_66_14]